MNLFILLYKLDEKLSDDQIMIMIPLPEQPVVGLDALVMRLYSRLQDSYPETA